MMPRNASFFAFFSVLCACGDPAPVAVSACQALPGVATDAAGLTLLEPLLTADEYAALAAAEPTAGLQKVGPEGLAALRERTRCVVNQVDDAGSGRWRVRLTRTSPEVRADGSLGADTATEIDWQAVKVDQIRIEAGVRLGAGMRAQIADALREGDHKRVAGLWRAIALRTYDPLAVVDQAMAQLAADAAYVQTRIKVTLDRVDTDEAGKRRVFAKVANRSKRDATDVTVIVRFPASETLAASELPVQTGPLAGEATAEISADLPEGFEGRVETEVTQVTLSPDPG